MNILNYAKIGLVAITLFLGFNNYRLINKVDRLDNELSIEKSNLKQYESLIDGKNKDNRVLQLTIDDFKETKDSLVKTIIAQTKDLKIKDKQLKEIASVETIITDTSKVIIKTKDLNFTEELKPNQLTTIKVARVDSVLTCILDIKNRQDLFIYEEKVYRNKKNFVQRIFTLDFKKDIISRYQILNTNDLINITDTRIIKLSK